MIEETTAEIDAHADQYLTFLLGDEEYGLPILEVQEIKSWGPITRLPRTPDHVLGVMNLRGAIVPVIDLRRCFGLPDAPRDASTAVIIVRPAGTNPDEGRRRVGLVVDRVSEVYRLHAEPVPAHHVASDADRRVCVSGFGRVDDTLVILLDLTAIVEAGLSLQFDGNEPAGPAARPDAGASHPLSASVTSAAP